ncbi:MAG: acyltransferase [Burkholderiales bacterium]|nr:acyltransferase [Burkholderiales bacterium]
MNRPLSIYLDLVRFVAACLVYLYHSNMRLLVTEPLPASQYGHPSVIVFFVLSGFVIAYVADTKERHWIDFASSRLARIYSVVVPAIVLTLILDFCGRRLYAELYDYPFDHLALRMAASALMLNEVWFVSITYLSNVPYWSINYETWYYALFGLVYFLPRRSGLLAAAAILLMLGPKILLLLPVWAAGVALYRWRRLQQISPAFGAALAIISFVAIPLFHWIGIFSGITAWTAAVLGEHWFRELTFSRFAVGDYLLCLLVMMNFAGMRRIADHLAPVLLAIERPVRAMAAYTFTLYLMHQPLFLFWGAVIRGDPDGLAYWTTLTVATGLSVITIGTLTENRRQGLKVWIHHLLTAATWRTKTRRSAV